MEYKGIEISRTYYSATVGYASASFKELDELKEWIDGELNRQRYMSAVKEEMSIVRKFIKEKPDFTIDEFRKKLSELRTPDARKALFDRTGMGDFWTYRGFNMLGL